MTKKLISGAILGIPAALLLVWASEPNAGGDWPMWGGTPDRNMVSGMKGVPTTWDVKTKKNVRWVVELGSQSYGNPVVAGGMVFVGTNNESPKDPAVKGDKGVRLYYVTNRCEIRCLDVHGDGKKHSKLIWKFDMMEEVGSQPHNISNSSPVSYGDLIFVSTSNGQDESHVHIPSPRAPSIIAVNKQTGKLAWEDNSVGDRILHGQWSSAAVGKIGDVMQVVIGQGDGWVRGYDAVSGKRLWWFDLNPKYSVWPKTRNEVISTPVIYQDRVYIGNGQDPEHGEGVGHFYCIDATKRGDITQTGRVWQYDKIRRSISTASIADGLVYIPDFSGFLHCLDAKTGQEYWTHDVFAAVWGSTLVVDGRIYLGDEDGDVVVMQAGKVKKVLAEMNMGSAVYATPVPAHGTLFINNRNQLF